MYRVMTFLIATAGLAWLGQAFLGPEPLAQAWPIRAENDSMADLSLGLEESTANSPIPLDGTPITDPEPELHPLYLPYVSVEFDALLPPPLETRSLGWVGSLTPSGREACHPATHVLLELPEGTRGNRAIAVLRPMYPEDPAINFDLFVGEYVDVVGASEPAPAACIITRQQLAVGTITALDPPPP